MDRVRTLKLRSSQLYIIYLLLISFLGGLLALLGVLAFPDYQPKLNFLLLLSLAAVTQVSATSIPVSRSGITYALGPAVTLATVPFYGPVAAALVEATAATALWVLKPADDNTWKKSWRQLAFNVGMGSVSIYAAGSVFVALRQQLGVGTFAGETMPWLVATVINDQLNLWILIGILRLQNGKAANPLQIWKENAWAMPIGIVSISIGGGLLALAVERFDWLGIVIFFLPIFLSSFADRLYVKQMQEHMNNLEEIVSERTKELEELMEQKDAFLAVLTHDMKTPLTTIGLYAEMIHKQPHLVAKKPHVAQVLLRSQKTLTEIVNNILDLEKLQSDQAITLDREDLDLVPMVEYLVEVISAQAQQKEIELHFRREVSAVPMSADRQQIERVVTNVLSNSIKYTPGGGQVDVTIQTNNGYAVLQVKDTGYGIPADELPHIFEPYWRVGKHKDKASGTGLGLAITKALIEAHQGRIEVTSEEGRGSTFTITLPLGGSQ